MEMILSSIIRKAIQIFIVIYFLSSNCLLANNYDLQQSSELTQKFNPLGFQENKGQIPDSSVLFKVESPGLNILITTSGLTYLFSNTEATETVHLQKVNVVLDKASIMKKNIITEGDITQGNISYYLGHCSNGISNVKTFKKVRIKEIFHKIDWILYISPSGKLKYDFIVHPGGNVNDIQLIYQGSGDFYLNNNQIQFENELGKVVEGKLFCYQGNKKNEITSNYKWTKNSYSSHNPLKKSNFNLNNNENISSYAVGFELSTYDTKQDLVIDPELVWGTLYSGSNRDELRASDIDEEGNLLVAGYTTSTDYTTTPGAFRDTLTAGWDAFVAKFNNDGVLLWATYYGGIYRDIAESITTDLSGNVFITGSIFVFGGPANTDNFPTSPQGTAYFDGVNDNDAFIVKFDKDGNRIWATYFGGNAGSGEVGRSITTDNDGNLFLTGNTTVSALGSVNIPMTAGNFQPNHAGFSDIFISKFNTNGTLLWSTYYGGDGSDGAESITVDKSNNLWITGTTGTIPLSTIPFPVTTGTSNIMGSTDACILKFDTDGNRLFASLHGGNGSDQGNSIISDLTGNVVITGRTESTDLPIIGGGFTQTTYGGATDIYILKIDSLGTELWSTYYGGSGPDFHQGSHHLAVDDCNNLYMSLTSGSNDLLTQPDASPCAYFNNIIGFGSIITKFDTIGNLLWSSSITNGETFNSIALDKNNNLFIAGGIQPIGGIVNPLLQNNGTYFDNLPKGNVESFLLKFKAPEITLSQTQTDLVCSNNHIGSATVTINTTCAAPPYSYIWSNGIENLNTTDTTNTISNLSAGNYSVVISSNYGKDTAFFTINVNSDFEITNLDSTNANCKDSCNGVATVTATGGLLPYTYLWNNGDTNLTTSNLCAGEHFIKVTEASGCVDSISFNIIEPDSLFVDAGNNIITCNSTAIINANASGGTPEYEYNWNNGLGVGQMQNLTSLFDTTLTYLVTVTDSNNCIAIDSVTVFAPLFPLTDFSVDTTESCLNSERVFTFTNETDTSNEQIETLQWNFGDGSPELEGESVSHIYTNSGIYDVTLTITYLISSCTFDTTKTDLINIFENPIADFGLTPEEITILSPTVSFEDKSTPSSNILLWNWFFDDNAISNDQNPQYTFSEDTGNYIINLIITDINGCKDSTTKTIKVEEVNSFFIPNSFTPNNDDINDVIGPNGNGISPNDYNLSIFNRWGELLFNTNKLSEKWNGTSNGKPMQAGTYIVKINFKNKDNQQKTMIKHINLIR